MREVERLLRGSGIKATLYVLDSTDVEEFEIDANEYKYGYESYVVAELCSNYLTDVIPAISSMQSDDRAAVFEELYAAIEDLNGLNGPSRASKARNGKRSTSWGTKKPSFATSKDTKEHLTASKVLNYADEVGKRVFGQRETLEKIQEFLLSAATGIGDPHRPRGSFMLIGDTGVGKTLIAKETARFLFGESYEDSMFVIEGSEFQQDHETAKLLGSPQGYVGYDQGSPFMDHIERIPESLILVDEFEKASRSLQDLFLHILDEGCAYNNRGSRVDFTHTLIVFTSNVGTKKAYRTHKVGFDTGVDCSVNSVLAELYAGSRPEFLKRFDDIIVVNKPDSDAYESMCRARVGELAGRLESSGSTLSVDPGVYGAILSSMKPGDTARDLNSLVRSYLEHPMAMEIAKNGRSGLKAYLLDGKIAVEAVASAEDSNAG